MGELDFVFRARNSCLELHSHNSLISLAIHWQGCRNRGAAAPDFGRSVIGLIMDFFIYGWNCCQFFFSWSAHMRRELAGVDFLDHDFYNLKKFTSTYLGKDLSNEGSNFILRPLEVGHWVAQTWVFFGKLPEITDFGPLQESEIKAWFWFF